MDQIVNEYAITGERVNHILFHGITDMFWNSLFYSLHWIWTGHSTIQIDQK